MNKRRILASLIFSLVLTILIGTFSGCTTSKKIPIPELKENVYIYDEAMVIDTDIAKRLNKMLIELEEQTEVNFIIVSAESLLNKSIKNYTNILFNALDIGKDNNILLLISPSDGKVRLKIGKDIEECLTKTKCDQIFDTYFVPYRKSNQYTKATSYTIQAVLKVLCEEYNITLDGLDMEAIQIKESNKTINSQIAHIIIPTIIFLIILKWITRARFID